MSVSHCTSTKQVLTISSVAALLQLFLNSNIFKNGIATVDAHQWLVSGAHEGWNTIGCPSRTKLGELLTVGLMFGLVALTLYLQHLYKYDTDQANYNYTALIACGIYLLLNNQFTAKHGPAAFFDAQDLGAQCVTPTMLYLILSTMLFGIIFRLVLEIGCSA